MQTVRTLARFYIGFIETVGIFGIAAVAIIAVVQVFFRYVVGASLFWSEELMRYLTIWAVFLVAGLSFSRGEMMGFTMAVDALPQGIRALAKFLVRIVVIAFLLVIAWYGFDFAMRTAHDKAIALRLSMFWVHLSVPVGCVLLALHVLAAQFQGEPRLSDDTIDEMQP